MKMTYRSDHARTRNRKINNERCRLKKTQLARMTVVSDTTIFLTPYDHPGMTKFSIRWLPKILTSPQSQQLVKCLLDVCNEDRDGVLSQIVTGDEFWVYH